MSKMELFDNNTCTYYNDDYFPTSIHVAFVDPKVGQNPEGRIISILEPEEDGITNTPHQPSK